MSKNINAEQIMSDIKYNFDVEDLFDNNYGIFTFGVCLVKELQSNDVDAKKLADDVALGGWNTDELDLLNCMRSYVANHIAPQADKNKYNSNRFNSSNWYNKGKKIDEIINSTFNQDLYLAKTLSKSSVSAEVKINVLWCAINALVLANF